MIKSRGFQPSMRAHVLGVALAALLPGCQLVPPRSPPLEVRTFSAEVPAAPTRVEHSRGEQVPKVRLGRVNAAANLHTRIVHRDSALELGEYESLRWSEKPDEYVRRSLARALFDERHIEQGIFGNLPTVDIEVVAFEEVRRGASRSGRVALRYRVHDDRFVFASGDVVVEQPAKSDDIEAVVEAIASALENATRQVADIVVARLSQPAEPAAPPSP